MKFVNMKDLFTTTHGEKSRPDITAFTTSDLDDNPSLAENKYS